MADDRTDSGIQDLPSFGIREYDIILYDRVCCSRTLDFYSPPFIPIDSIVPDLCATGSIDSNAPRMSRIRLIYAILIDDVL